MVFVRNFLGGNGCGYTFPNWYTWVGRSEFQGSDEEPIAIKARQKNKVQKEVQMLKWDCSKNEA